MRVVVRCVSAVNGFSGVEVSYWPVISIQSVIRVLVDLLLGSLAS